MEQAYKRPFSKGYLIFWSSYWIFALCFLVINYRSVLGDEEISGKGVLIFFAFLTVVAFSIWFTAFALRPRFPLKLFGKKKAEKLRPWNLIPVVLVDIWCFNIMELVNNEKFAEMTFKFRVINVFGIFIMSLILLLWTNSRKRAMFITLCFFAAFTITFYIVYSFRGEPLQLIDFYSAGTALNAAKNYRFVITRWITGEIVIGMCVAAVIIHMPEKVLAKRLPGKFAVRFGALAVMISLAFFYTRTSWNAGLGILTDLFAPIKTYREYGTTVGFFCVAKYMRLTPPEGYSVAEVERIAKEARKNAGKTEDTRGSEVKPVNIIAIMNESLCDYRLVGDLRTDKKVMPFYDSLEENTIKGHTLVCIRGGGTAKSEYEFLTGNSVKRYPGMVPYVSYFRNSQYSIVTTLEAQGYDSVVMHPYKRTNWNRPVAYELLDFNRYISIEDFDDRYDRIRGFVSDRGNYQKIIELVEEKEEGSPLFLFNITMQNHGGYEKKNCPVKIRLMGDYQDESVERFLTLERESDDALQYLIEYFGKCEEPTIILMFGDHYPTLPDEFTESISGSKYDDLTPEEQVKYFSTPFLIWANYDIPEKDGVITSCNYLNTMLLEQTGLSMTDYNYYLRDLAEEMPALNHMGYYDGDGVFHIWEDGDENILEMEREYECIQHNELAESQRRIDSFFALEE